MKRSPGELFVVLTPSINEIRNRVPEGRVTLLASAGTALGGYGSLESADVREPHAKSVVLNTANNKTRIFLVISCLQAHSSVNISWAYFLTTPNISCICAPAVSSKSLLDEISIESLVICENKSTFNGDPVAEIAWPRPVLKSRCSADKPRFSCRRPDVAGSAATTDGMFISAVFFCPLTVGPEPATFTSVVAMVEAARLTVAVSSLGSLGLSRSGRST